MKKALIYLLLVAIMVSSVPCFAFAETYKLGDINGNGKTDMADYVLLKRAYFGTYVLDGILKTVADCNKNGKIDMADYVLLKRAYFGTYTLDKTPIVPDISDDSGFLNETKHWGGDKVNFLVGGNGGYQDTQVATYYSDEDSVLNSIYERTKLIKDKYGIEIEVQSPSAGESVFDLVREDIMAAFGEFDAVVSPIYYIAPLAAEGMLKDFNSADGQYIHLDQAWWDKSLIEDTALNGKVFFLAGDALLNDDEATWAMYFNKDLVNEYGLENPYDLVKSNEWTLDKMYEMAKSVELTNGAEKSFEPEDGDIWGMVTQAYDFGMFMQGGEQTMIDNNGDVPVLRIIEEENVNTFYKIADFFMFDDKNIGVADYRGKWYEGVYEKERLIFANGNALFMPGAVSDVNSQIMLDADINYGILPMPKRDNTQDKYTSGVNTYNFDVISVPINNVEKFDMTCYALEAMAYYGKETVTPEYYEKILTNRKNKDEDSKDMLDLIFRNRTYDLGTVFNFNTGNEYIGTLYFYSNLLGERSDFIVSYYAQYESAYQIGIDNLIDCITNYYN